MRALYRWSLLAAAVLAIGGAVYLVLRPNPVIVELASVTRGKFVATAEDDGRTRVRDR